MNLRTVNVGARTSHHLDVDAERTLCGLPAERCRDVRDPTALPTCARCLKVEAARGLPSEREIRQASMAKVRDRVESVGLEQRAPGCRITLTVTPKHQQIETAARRHGGTLIALEIAHNQRFQLVGSQRTRRRALTLVRERRAMGLWETAHVHDDGTIYIDRETRHESGTAR